MSSDNQGRDYKDTIHLPETAFPMRGDLPKREPETLARWEASRLYPRLQEATAARPSFILHDGPPYANGQIHIGHAVNKTLKDIVVKSKLLGGFRSDYVPGWDCHGLPIELAVEKEVGKVGQKIDAPAFRAKCREYAAKQIDGQREDFKRLGVLGVWDQPYRTMDFKFEADMLRTFARIVENGHLARGVKPVHWCFDCGSALAEAEIEYADKQSPAIDVAFDFVDSAAVLKIFSIDAHDAIVTLPIWTTTPWTLPANLAVTLHAEFDYVLIEAQPRAGRRVQIVVAEDLFASVSARYGLTDAKILGRIKGAALEGLKLRHCFYDRQVPVILGDHVTADSGTGAVHTAPGHGQEDFVVGQKYDLGVLNPVGSNGVFVPGTEYVEGLHVWKANDAIIQILRDRGVLLAFENIQHSYPHCWRHKTPVAFRTTPQWFISMEQAGLRADALAAIKNVHWMPEWGEERISLMVRNRPDWCISRQRTWGVPIALFIDKVNGEPHPDSAKLLLSIADHVEQHGVDCWYELDAEVFLGAEAAKYEKVTDILDVWFDSGVTHACVLNQRAELRGDRVGTMYLEGSDQHRGWFQSSLMTSVALNRQAPFSEVITHGFTVDAQGRKMSKSMGNVVAPQKVVSSLGADILRLWTASTDYHSEMSVSDEILKRVADTYRRLRNTARFLLGNLAGFDPVRDRVPTDQMLLLDRWAMRQAEHLMKLARRVYGQEAGSAFTHSSDTYAFAALVQELMRFCTIDMGASYLDMTKDRLYTLQESSLARRSAQTAMVAVLEVLVRALAPITSFTSEELWSEMPGREHDSVFFSTWSDLDACFAGLQLSAEEDALIALLTEMRSVAQKTTEALRNADQIGGSLQAEITLYLDAACMQRVQPVAEELRFFFIAADVKLAELQAAPESASSGKLEGVAFKVSIAASPSAKCVRCWQHRADVGQSEAHPSLCGRCITNVDGSGESRVYF